MLRCSHVFNLLVVTSISLLSSGCGDSKKLIEVNGTATHAGKPLANVILNFSDANGNWASSGQTDSEGHFKLRIMSNSPTIQAHTCNVWVSLPPRVKEDQDGNVVAKDKKAPDLQDLLRKYGKASSTSKTVEIKETELNLDLD